MPTRLCPFRYPLPFRQWRQCCDIRSERHSPPHRIAQATGTTFGLCKRGSCREFRPTGLLPYGNNITGPLRPHRRTAFPYSPTSNLSLICRADRYVGHRTEGPPSDTGTRNHMDARGPPALNIEPGSESGRFCPGWDPTTDDGRLLNFLPGSRHLLGPCRKPAIYTNQTLFNWGRYERIKKIEKKIARCVIRTREKQTFDTRRHRLLPHPCFANIFFWCGTKFCRLLHDKCSYELDDTTLCGTRTGRFF